MDPQVITQAIIAVAIGVPIMFWTEWEAYRDRKRREREDTEDQ
jgi:hypothetical protein